MGQEPSQPRAVKYNFDTVFGEQSKVAADAAVRRGRSSYSSDEVERMRTETFAAGKAETEAKASATRAQALTIIGDKLSQTMAKMDEALADVQRDSAELAIAIGRKLAESAINAFPMSEVEAIVADCLHKLHQEPRLVVRVSPPLAEQLKTQINELADRHGYAGRVVILAEPSLNGANCGVEWAGGGIERDISGTLGAIDEAVERWRALIEVRE